MTSREAGSLARSVALGTGLAVIAVLAIYGLAIVTGASLVVTPPGRAAGVVSVIAAIVATVVAGVLTWLLALTLRRLARARIWYLLVTVAALLVSFASPLGAADNMATAVWLSLMHLAVAATVIPLTARAFPGGAR